MSSVSTDEISLATPLFDNLFLLPWNPRLQNTSWIIILIAHSLRKGIHNLDITFKQVNKICGLCQVLLIATSRKSHLQQIFLGYADVKGSKTDTISQAYCFVRFMLMDIEIIKIDETPNLQRNTHISFPHFKCA